MWIRCDIPRFRLALGIALTLATVTGLMALSPPLARGQETMRIAAVVNDDVISVYDLAARISIIVAASKLRDAPDLRRQIAPRVLRTLVDEYLQTQEAARLDIEVTERDIEFAINQIEQRQGLGKRGLDNFVRNNRIDRDAVIAMLKAEIAWNKLISRRLNSAISVGEDEIDEALARLEENRGQPEYRVAEIFLAIESQEQEQEIMKTAENLLVQLQQGADFRGIAQQFSESATSAVGGDIGWVIVGQLSKQIDSILPNLAVGKISGLIRTFDGVQIIKLVDRRNLLTADPLDTRVHLAQIIIDDFGTDRELAVDHIRDVHGESADCADMLERSSEFTSPQSGDLGVLKIGDMPLDLREIVQNAMPGQLSEPHPFGNGLRILMTCSRVEAKVELPTRATMRQDIGSRRLELQAKRYLRDLRRAAFIDFRV